MTTQPNFYAVIPANVRYSQDLEMGAKLLYGEITSLTHAEGFCWASNQYFAELYCVDVSTIKRWISSLKNNKFISVVTESQGINTNRRIFVSPEIQKVFTKAQKRATPSSKTSHPQLKNEPLILKTNNKEEREGEGLPPRPPASSPLYSNSFFTNNKVKMESEKYQKLVTEFGKAKIDEMLERLNEYAEINPKRFKQYACHAAVLRKWIRDDQTKNGKSPESLKHQREENNRIFLKEVEKKIPDAIKAGKVVIGNDYIEFVRGHASSCIKCTDYGFVEQIKGNLSKMGITH